MGIQGSTKKEEREYILWKWVLMDKWARIRWRIEWEMPPVNAGRSPRDCCTGEPGVVVMFGTPWAEQVRMQVEMLSDHVEVTLESLVSSGEREAGKWVPEEHLFLNQLMPWKGRNMAITEDLTCPAAETPGSNLKFRTTTSFPTTLIPYV